MQFHHHGYVSTDPRIQPAARSGNIWSPEFPEELDVLIVGAGPAGMITAAQLSMFETVRTRIVDLRAGRLEIGRADGLQSRSLETFQAFGFAHRVAHEAYHIQAMNFWSPDPDNPDNIIRTARTEDDPQGISEFPHVIMNQARVIDYFDEFMRFSPTRLQPDYGSEFVSLEVDHSETAGEYPITVTLRRRAEAGAVVDDADAEHRDAGGGTGDDFVVRCKYVVGADGARSGVRKAIGRSLSGAQANHAWGVVDMMAVTDFPDIHTKCAITSKNGSILHIPREGGHLFRCYVDLGEVPEGSRGEVRKTTVDEAIARANEILHPYSLDVKEVAWYSVYEVGHRLTDDFDDVADNDNACDPRVFIMGDACHTHSAKAGQGMNVSMQDGFNLAWKLGHVVDGRAPKELLRTYSSERQVAAKNLIDFDREWSSQMAKKPEDFGSPQELADFYCAKQEFAAGFLTDYDESMITGSDEHQALAAGFPIGRRFKSAEAIRIADDVTQHIGHQHSADGRWRIYVFADEAAPGVEGSAVEQWAAWWASDDSPRQRHQLPGGDQASIFDTKVIYRQAFDTFDVQRAPAAFRPTVGKYGLHDIECIYGTGRGTDIFAARGIAPEGAVVVVRPDQYVAHVLPLEATRELAEFFAGNLVNRAA